MRITGKLSRSRGAFFVRAPSFPANHVVFGASPRAVPGFHFVQSRLPKKGKRNAERRVVNSRALPGTGRALRSALASRRPTAALARETAGPQGSAPGHASGDSPGRSILYGRPNREAETLRFSTGVTRAGKTNVLSPYSEHLACRSLCRQDDARCRPGAGYKPARRHRTRPVPRSVLAKNVPSKGEMGSFSSTQGEDSRNSGGAIHPVDSMQIFFGCLFDSPRRNYGKLPLLGDSHLRSRKRRCF